MAGTLIGNLWVGYCPECASQEMQVNERDFFECPVCHLQIGILGGEVTILPVAGTGKFKMRSGAFIMAMDELPVHGDHHIRADGRNE